MGGHTSHQTTFLHNMHTHTKKYLKVFHHVKWWKMRNGKATGKGLSLYEEENFVDKLTDSHTVYQQFDIEEMG